jgi:hypothetical protein
MFYWFYSTRSFRGDAEILDSGFWSHPRYHIRFPEMRLDKPGEYVFTCSGLPPTALTLTLNFVGPQEYNALKQIGTQLEFRMTDDEGRELCRSSGAMKEWELSWRVADNAGGLWQPSCRDVTVKRNMTYSFNLIVRDVDPNSPVIHVRPTLAGGGNELP